MEWIVDFLKQRANEKGILTIFFRTKERCIKKDKKKKERTVL